MEKELTPEEKTVREISEKNNPYAPECPNKHLWSEGFRSGYKYAIGVCDFADAVFKKPVEIPEISDEMLELDNPWNTMDVITKLIWATEYLLHNKSYDGHNYEELNICVTRGKEILHYMKEWYREEQRKRVTKWENIIH